MQTGEIRGAVGAAGGGGGSGAVIALGTVGADR